MQLPTGNSPRVFLGHQTGHHWNPLKLGKEEKITTINQNADVIYRALIVDRDSMASGLLAHALAGAGRYDAVAINADDLLRAVSTGEVNLVIISADLNQSWGTGFDLTEAVCHAYPETYVIILLNEVTQESVANAFRAGARGVFSRQQPIPEFLDCVDHVRKGFVWAGREETNLLLHIFKTFVAPSLLSDDDLPELTARELEVVKHAAKGKTNKVIAKDLRLSEHTVKNYLFRAFAKLGVSSRIELLFFLTNRGHSFGAEQEQSVQPIESLD
jgi:two-component system nitrate/nitrite response regulator NarL